ncbi:MAG: Gfo/Idh/MocA family protein, partial [Sedimentisphaerales bacterium]
MDARQPIKRRTFLKRAIGTAGGVAVFGFPRSGVPPYIVPSSALGKAGNVAASNRITMGCIGVGSRGTSIMQSLLGTGEVQIVCVCDVDADRRKRAKDLLASKYNSTGCATYSDFRELVARDDIDAVSIATPDHWHALPTIAAAKAGKAIYCEKPLGLTIDQGRKMVD